MTKYHLVAGSIIIIIQLYVGQGRSQYVCPGRSVVKWQFWKSPLLRKTKVLNLLKKYQFIAIMISFDFLLYSFPIFSQGCQK